MKIFFLGIFLIFDLVFEKNSRTENGTRFFNDASYRWVGSPTPCALFLTIPGKTDTCYWVDSGTDL